MYLWWRVVQRLGVQLYRRRVRFLFLALVVASLGTYALWLRSPMSQPATVAPGGALPVEVAVEPLTILGDGQGGGGSDTDRATLTLKEMNGSRRIAMNLDDVEALAIAQLQPSSGAEVPQGQQTGAFNLLRSTISALGGSVAGVVIDSSNGSSYTAQIDVSTPDGEKSVPARPADGIALALEARAPVYVDDAVLEKYGSSTSSSGSTASSSTSGSASPFTLP